MYSEETMEEVREAHSPFVPLFLLVVCLGAWMGFHVFSLYQDKVIAQQTIEQLAPQANDALTAKKKLFSLARDLNVIADKDPVAGQIIDEFKIRFPNPPASGQGSSTNDAP